MVVDSLEENGWSLHTVSLVEFVDFYDRWVIGGEVVGEFWTLVDDEAVVEVGAVVGDEAVVEVGVLFA
jgi:hypothetical protein